MVECQYICIGNMVVPRIFVLVVYTRTFFYRKRGSEMSFDVGVIEKYWPLLLSGVPIILLLSLLSAFFGSVIGLASVFLRRWNKVTKFIVSAYIDIFRGTPVYVQLIFFYFGLPGLFPSFMPSELVSCVVVFSLNSGAYLSEIIRAGVDDIDKGQIEAAKALGVGSKDIAKDIIIPQAFRKVLPALMNEFITLTKETSVVSAIGVSDMMYRYQAVKSTTWATFEPLLVVFVVYYVMNKVLSLIGKWLERKMKYD